MCGVKAAWEELFRSGGAGRRGGVFFFFSKKRGAVVVESWVWSQMT